MKKYRQKFAYWEDEHTKLIKESKPPEFLDPDYYVDAHIRSDKAWPHRYFLNNACWRLMKDHGPFTGWYHDCEELVDQHVGETAYIFCPGPSMGSVDTSAFSDKLTLAVNSAAFGFKDSKPSYWVMAEGAYARWLLDQRYSQNMTIIATARVAVMLRREERRFDRQKFKKIYVARWEEEKIVPPRTPAVSITNALVSAWEMGCPKAIVIGCDLSKPGKPYVEGVPYTDYGAKNPFDDQIMALRQFELPDFEVVNTSPYSHKWLENFEYVTIEDLMNNLRERT